MPELAQTSPYRITEVLKKQQYPKYNHITEDVLLGEIE